jgi:hypothetical protein
MELPSVTHQTLFNFIIDIDIKYDIRMHMDLHRHRGIYFDRFAVSAKLCVGLRRVLVSAGCSKDA